MDFFKPLELGLISLPHSLKILTLIQDRHYNLIPERHGLCAIFYTDLLILVIWCCVGRYGQTTKAPLRKPGNYLGMFVVWGWVYIQGQKFNENFITNSQCQPGWCLMKVRDLELTTHPRQLRDWWVTFPGSSAGLVSFGDSPFITLGMIMWLLFLTSFIRRLTFIDFYIG